MPWISPPRGPVLGVPPSGSSTRKSEYEATRSNLSPSALMIVQVTSFERGLDDQWNPSYATTNGPLFFVADRSTSGAWMPASATCFAATGSATTTVLPPVAASAETVICFKSDRASGRMPLIAIVLPDTVTAGSTPLPDTT